ncbi:MAG: hypothetical protein K2Q06_13825 [Parvularculaceae bacterium]|nr:hypothetical protein [Parvularculaceae bacterium]
MRRVVVLSFLMLGACATRDHAGAPDAIDGDAPRWAANGWLTPGPSGEPEIIGVFARREDCEAAVESWKQRQVVGNPIYGACLPIDRR